MPRNILIVEDDNPFRELLVEVVTEFGYQVVTAENGLKALQQLAKHPVDLILSDINMPVMNGIDMLISLRAKYPNTPVILVTGLDPKDFEQVAKRYGVYGMMEKPLKLGELNRMIDDAFNRQVVAKTA